MLYVGIDVASDHHDVAFMNSSEKYYKGTHKIDDSRTGYKKLLKLLEEAKQYFNECEVRVGLESTGSYSTNILLYCLEQKLPTMLINPILTTNDRKANSVHPTKTDQIDCKGIACYLFRHPNDFSNYTIKSYHIQDLLGYSKLRMDFNKEKNVYINRLKALLHSAFPEFLINYNNFRANVPLKLLELHSSLKSFRNCHLSTLTNEMKKLSKGKYGQQRAKELKELAKNSIGHCNDSDSYIINYLVKRILTIQEDITILEEKCSVILNKLNVTITTIKGIGNTLCSIIVSEIKDINLFSNDAQLLAFSGLDPVEYQSGKIERVFRSSKRGSSMLRWAIMESARLVSIYNPVFKTYYEKKLSQGKHHFVALTHVAKKLLRVIRHLLRTGESYFVASSQSTVTI
jgi:transposase